MTEIELSAADTGLQAPASAGKRTTAAEVWHQGSRHKGAVVGMIVFCTIIAVVLLGRTSTP